MCGKYQVLASNSVRPNVLSSAKRMKQNKRATIDIVLVLDVESNPHNRNSERRQVDVIVVI